jgi:hypothetical protein
LNLKKDARITTKAKFAGKFNFKGIGAIISEEEEDQSEETIRDIQGDLRKHCPNKLFGGYENRYCTLENGLFRYFKNEKDDLVKGTLNFDLYKCSCTLDQNNHFIMTIDGANRNFKFQAKDE